MLHLDHAAYVYGFVMILKIRETVSINDINRLLFLMQLHCVYCEVRNEFSVISLRRIITRLSPRKSGYITICEICGGHIGIRRGCPPMTSVPPVIIIIPVCSIFIHFEANFIRRISWPNLGSSKKAGLSHNREHWRQTYFLPRVIPV